MLGRQSRHWMVTINNPPRPFMSPPIPFDTWRTVPSYACYQLEAGSEGTPHFQMYVSFCAPVRGSTLSRMLACSPHLEIRNGTHAQVIKL